VEDTVGALEQALMDLQHLKAQMKSEIEAESADMPGHTVPQNPRDSSGEQGNSLGVHDDSLTSPFAPSSGDACQVKDVERDGNASRGDLEDAVVGESDSRTAVSDVMVVVEELEEEGGREGGRNGMEESKGYSGGNTCSDDTAAAAAATKGVGAAEEEEKQEAAAKEIGCGKKN